MSDLQKIISVADYGQISKSIESCVAQQIYYLELHITDVCNSNCYFCNQKDLRIQGKEIDFGILKSFLTQMKSYGLRGVRISGGGEPTTYSRLDDLLDLLLFLQIKLIRFDTNGISLTPELSRKLISTGLQHLHVSLQAPTGKTWSLITGKNPCYYERIVNNIDAFSELDVDNKVDINVSFVFDENTYIELEKIVQFSKAHTVNYFIHAINSYDYSDFFKRACIPELMRQIKQTPELKSSCQWALVSLNVEPWMHKLPDRFYDSICFAPWTSALVKSNGDVYRCCEHQHELGILGNINNDAFIDLWNDVKIKDIRYRAKELFFYKNFFDPPCPNRCAAKIGLFSIPELSQKIEKILF
jgi:radical SAM protein with 4Fe4S-binding SPASM domain